METTTTAYVVTSASDLDAVSEAHIAMVRIDAHGLLRDANDQFARLVGLTKSAIDGRRFDEVLAPEDAERLFRPLRKLRRSGGTVAKEARFVHSTGERVRVFQTFIAQPGSAEITLLAHGQDFFAIREEAARELETHVRSALEDRVKELEAINAELTGYNHAVAHDMRGPVTAVAGLSEVLLRRKQASQETRRVAQSIREAAEHAKRVLDGLSRLNGIRRAAIQRNEVDVSKLVRDTVKRLRMQFPARRVETRIEKRLVAKADPDLARILVENLVSNAWKFTGNRKVARINFFGQEKDGKTYFVLSDNGIGFDPQNAQGLFTPFRRLHDDKKFEGTGIGLATSKEIVRRHSGDIYAEARPGEGAEFWFTLSRWQGWST